MDLDALETALGRNPVKACIALTNFHNPLGRSLSDESKERLVGLLAKPEIPLIEDDVHGDLSFTSPRPIVAKAFDKKGLVLLCSSFSKTLAPGYRVGWVAAGKFQEAVERLKFINTIATPTINQLAVAEFLRIGGYDHHLRSLRRAFSYQIEKYSDAIAQYFPEGTRVSRPDGGFVLWVEMPRNVDSLELHRQGLVDKISICPGPIFSATQKYKNFIRVSCGAPWEERMNQAVKRLGELAHILNETSRG